MDLLYKPKRDTWYLENTLVVLLDDYRPEMNSGLFLGTRKVENSRAEGGREIGTLYLDQEVCSFDEFEEMTV